jgi:hypothetical protein
MKAESDHKSKELVLIEMAGPTTKRISVSRQDLRRAHKMSHNETPMGGCTFSVTRIE